MTPTPEDPLAVDPVSIAIGVAGVGGLVGGGAALRRWIYRNADAAWRALAREREGRFRRGWLSGPQLEVREAGVRVTLGARSDDRGFLQTVALAMRPDSMWWEAATIPAGAVLSHASFGTPEDARLLRLVRPVSVVAAKGRATILVDGTSDQREPLLALIALAARIASLPRWGPIHALEGASPVDLRNDAVDLERRGLVVRLEGTRWGGEDGLMISATTTRELPRFAIRIDAEGTLGGDAAPGLLRGEDLRPPPRLGPALLKLDADSMRLYTRPAPTTGDLEAAIGYLVALARPGPASGAFR